MEDLGRELEQETGEEERKFEHDVPPAPPPPTCAFQGPNGVLVTEADLRSAVANAASRERQKWLDSTSQTLQNEANDKRFGDLVRYWLAGLGGKVHPGKLEAVQQAALNPSITYGNLGNATLNAAVQKFGDAEKKVNDWIEKVYERSAVEDSARANFRTADAALRMVDKAFRAAGAAVKLAEARVRDTPGQSRAAAQAALDTEREALRTATTARSTARKDRDDKKKHLDEAKSARAMAEKEFRGARTARKPLDDLASDWKLADRQKVRKALLAKAAGTDTQNIDDIVDQALMAAHRSRADAEAWSAVFVVSCVRAAAIGRKLETMDTSGAHVGKDGLLKASRKHAEYVVEARKRERKGAGGTYHAFEPRDPVVQVGDIICTDRTNFIGKPVSLEKLEVGTELHCDIVTSIESENGKPVFAETTGGNVRHTVRRRRYPLDSQGRLVKSEGELFAQEEDDGTFLPFETLNPVPKTMLAVRSTGRILALLSLICKPVSGTAGKGAPKGESLDEENLAPEPQTGFDSSDERLAYESPFVGALEERRSRFDQDHLEGKEAAIHTWYQGYTPLAEGQELKELHAAEVEWESDLAALETEDLFGDALEQGRTTLSEPEELEKLFGEEHESAWEHDEYAEDEAEAYDAVAADLEVGIEGLHDAESPYAEETEEALAEDAASLEEELLLLEEAWIEPEDEDASSLKEAAYAGVEPAHDEDLFIEHEGFLSLLSPGVIMQRAKQLLGEGVFSLSLVGRFASGQIWNEDHLALEVFFHRQPRLRPAGLDTVPGSRRLRLLHWLAVKYQRELAPIRERIVRPIFGNPASFQVGSAEGCQIQDLREEVRKLGPLVAGTYKSKVYYKRAEHASPRKESAIDSIALHHMAFNIGNDVNSYKKVGAHYIVTADGQIAQLYDDLDFMNASDGFNPRSVAIEFAGNFSDHRYHWWKSSKQTIPDRCYLTPTQIRAGRCLLATLKKRLPDIKYLYAHRQSSKDRTGDPGPDVWFNIGEWALANLNLTDRLPRTHIGTGQPIPDSWRMSRSAIPAMTMTPTPDKESFVDPEEEEVDWETSVSEQSPVMPAGVAEFAVALGKEWAKRRNGSPSAEKITEWLLRDYQDTLEGARHRFEKYPGDDFIGRGWVISRQNQMRFQTSSSAGVKPLPNFQPPTDSVALVSNQSLIQGSDKAPVAPAVVRFVQELRQRYRGSLNVSTYRGHGGGRFENRGYSIDLFIRGRDDRGFYPPEEAVKFLRALREAAGATGAEWRVIYNDFSVADTINRETSQERVIFVGTARQDKNRKITGLNWHGPHPLILHFHLDLAPSASASNASASVPSASTSASTSKPIPGAAKPPAEVVRFAQRVLNAIEGERLAVDGDPGPLTRGALERFRRKYDLGAGGVLDDKTHLALAQRALEEIARQSIYPQAGVLDAKTEQALTTFRSDRGLGFGATLDAATRAALADALAQRASVPSAPLPLATPGGLPKLGAGLTPPTDPTAYRKFRLTTYHVVDQRELQMGAVRVPIYDDNGRKIAEGSPAFFAQLSLEGTARLIDERLINVTGKNVPVSHDEYAEVLAYHLQAYAKRDKKRREEGKGPTPTAYSGIVVEKGRVVRALAFHEVPASRRGIGYGLLRGVPLVPFRTLAADIGHTKYQVEPKWKGKGGLVPPGTHVYIKEYDGLRLPDGTTHDGWFIVNDTGGAIFGAHFDVFVGTGSLRKQVELPALGQVWFAGIEQRIPPGYTYGLKA